MRSSNRPSFFPKHKHTASTTTKISLSILAALLLLIVIGTCPNKESHQYKVKQLIDKAVTDVSEELTEDNPGNVFATYLIQGVANTYINNLFRYHNYVFFSTGSLEQGAQSKLITVGALGFTYTLIDPDFIPNNIRDDIGLSARRAQRDRNN